MPPLLRQNKLATKLAKGVKQSQQPSKRKRAYIDDADDVEVSWGAPIGSISSSTVTRRATRHNGLSNKQYYKSVVVNENTYEIGQAVKVRGASDDSFLAIIFKLFESEVGEKQVVVRWLLRPAEVILNGRLATAENEVFYSNADDLVEPDVILAPLDVGSEAGQYVCRRYFNEQTAEVGDLHWNTFYGEKRLLDESVDQAMFRPRQMKSKEATKKAVAAKRARSNIQTKPRKPATRKRAASINDVSDDNMDEEFDEASDEEEEEEEEEEVAKPTRRRRKPQAPAAASRTSKRKLRLQDIQPTGAVAATLAKRAARPTHTRLADQDGANMYEIARQRLHVSAVPDTLPCREDEFAEIYGHLYTAIEERTSMCMYISGVPGTGKTATVREAIRTLQESAEEGDLPQFQFVELNGMKMTEPQQAYTQLWQAITGSKVTPKHAAQLLESHFSTPSPRRHAYVVLMDELDLLVTKSQSVMYNFFDWPHRAHAKLIVIAIANTMDLPERMLHHKVSSRLGLTRINFQPYSHTQLFTIVESRLQGCQAFDPDAVELCARKISAVSGDARRALDVCRRAVEMVEAEWRASRGTEKLVTMMVINRAVKEMYASGHVAFIQNAATQQKMFLVALRAAIRKAGVPEVSLGDVAYTHRQLCKLHNMAILSVDQVATVCAQLGATRCILAESSMLDVHQMVRLGVAEDDITVALRPDPLFQRIVGA